LRQHTPCFTPLHVSSLPPQLHCISGSLLVEAEEPERDRDREPVLEPEREPAEERPEERDDTELDRELMMAEAELAIGLDWDTALIEDGIELPELSALRAAESEALAELAGCSEL